MNSKKIQDIRITDPKLIKLWISFKKQHKGARNQDVLGFIFKELHERRQSLIQRTFDDLIEISNGNKSFNKLLNLTGQILSFPPVISSKEVCDEICNEFEENLIKYFKKWGKNDKI